MKYLLSFNVIALVMFASAFALLPQSSFAQSTVPSVSIAAPTDPSDPTAPYTVTEGGSMEFTLTRTGATTGTLTVGVVVTQLTGGTDRLPPSPPSTATFAAGSDTATLTIDLPGDLLDKPDRTIHVLVAAGSGYTVGVPDSATGIATDDDEVPGVPTGVGATAVGAGVTVSWTAPTDAGTSAITRYDVRHIESAASDKSDGNWTVVNGGAASPHTVRGLTNGTGYDFQVRAVSAAGESAWTGTATATPMALMVNSIERHDGTTSLGEHTNADELKFRVTFSEGVTGVDAADFTASGTTSPVTVTASTTAVYIVTISGTTGNLNNLDGTVSLALTPSPHVHGIADTTDGTALTNLTPGTTESYTVDNTTPTLVSIHRQTPSGEHTSANSLVFRVTFSEPVNGVDTADFAVDGATTATVTGVSGTAPTATWDVTVSGGDLTNLNSTVGLTLDATGHGITDRAGNALTSTRPTGQTYTLDNTAPTLVSIHRENPTGEHTNSDQLVFRVTFSEPVNGSGASDFTVSGTSAGIVALSGVDPVTVRDVTIRGGDLANFNGAVGLTLDATGHGITDRAGNALTSARPTGQTYTVDNAAPTVTSATVNGATLVLTFNEALAPVGAGLTNAAFTVKKTPQGGSEETVSLTGTPSVSGTTLTLTLASAVVASDGGITVGYTRPSGANNRARDTLGHEVADTVTPWGVTNSTPGMVFSARAVSIEEGGTGSYTVKLNTAPASTVTVAITGHAGTDVTPSPTSLAFTTTDYGTAQTVSVSATADADDTADTVTLTHTASGGGSDYAGATGDVVVTVQEPDSITVTVDTDSSTTGAQTSLGENAGGTTISVSVDLGSTTVSADTMFTITLGGTDDTATSGTDYAALSTNPTLTVLSGQSTGTGSFTLTPMADTVDERDETLTVTVSAVGYTGTATITLTDEDAAPTVTLEAGTASIVENGGTTVITARLSHASVAETVVTLTDHAAFTGEGAITIAAGSLTGTRTLTAVDNDIHANAANTVSVAGTATNSLASGGTTTVDPVSVTITDDETLPTLTLMLSANSISEDGGTTTLTATLSGKSSAATTVTVGANAAYTGHGTITIAAGATSGTRTLTAVDNDIDAPNNDVMIPISVSGGHDVVDPGDVPLTITDDDATPTVTLMLSANSISEDGGTTTLTATLSHGSSAITTITVGAQASHYMMNPASGVITFPANAEGASLSGTVTLTAVDVPGDADDKSVTVSATASGGRGVANPTSVPLTITDDDTATVSLVLSATRMLESDDGDSTTPNNYIEVYPQLDIATIVDVTVTLQPRAGIYTVPSGTGAATFTIAAGDLTPMESDGSGGMRIKKLRITAVDDTVDEANLATSVMATVGTNTRGITNPADVAFTLEDDDAAPTVELVLSPASIPEDDDSTTTTIVENRTTVTARLTGGTTSAGITTVTVSAAAVAPAVAGDFTLAGTTLTIAAGAPASTGTVTLTAQDNTADHPNRVVRVSGVAVNACTGCDSISNPAFVDVTITDDEAAPTVTLELSETTIDEVDDSTTGAEKENETTLTARLSHPSSGITTVTVAASAGDYTMTPSNGVITIAAGATTGTLTLTAADNDVDAPNNVVTVSATAAIVGGGPDAPANPADMTLTITDDDAAPTVTLVRGLTSIGENAGTTTVTATLSHPSAGATTVTVSAAPVAPAVAGDFTLTGTTLTIAAGAETSTGTVTLTAVNNNADHPNRVVTVSGVAANPCTGCDSISNPASVDVTIVDDEVAPTVTLELSPETINEVDDSTTTDTDNETTLTARLSHPSSGTTTVTVAASADDYTMNPSTGIITIAPGATTGTLTLTAVNNNVDAPDNVVTISATATNVGGGDPISNPADVTLTIEDDEAAPTVRLVLSKTTLAEEDDSTTALVMEHQTTVTATLSHPSSGATTITVSAVGVAPADANDFTLAGTTLTIAAGAETSTGTVTLTAQGNTEDHPDRVVTVSGAAVNTGGGDPIANPAAVSVTITDNEATPTVTLMLSPATIAETGAQTTVTATLNRASSDHATKVTVSANAAYTVAPADRIITIAAGATSGTLTLTAVDNDLDAPDNVITVSATATNDHGVTGPAARTLTITDNEARPTVTLSLGESTISENDGSTTLTATLDVKSSQATTVTVTANPRYFTTNPANGVISIAPGATSGTLTLTAVDDSIDNHYRTRTSTGGAHRATMVAATPANDYQVNPAITSLPLTLTDDDEAGIVVVPPTGGFNTRENGADLTFGVRLTSQPAGGSLGLYVYVYESWTDPDDSTTLVLTDEVGPAQQYVQKSGSGWNTPAMFTLTPEDDALPDGDQSFFVFFLAESSGAGASSHPAYTAYFTRSQSQGSSSTWERRVRGTNADDEVLPDGISFIVLPNTISESDDPATTGAKENETTVTVAQAGTSGLATTVTVAANPAFTMTPADGVVTIPAGSATTTLTLTAVDNTVDAPDAPLFITATASNSLGTVPVTRGSLTITDDDAAPTVQLSLFPSSVSENGGTTRVTARLSHASSEATTVTVTADSAFTTPGGRVITIPAGSLSGSLQLRAVDRPGDADAHTVTVAATAANDQGVGAVRGATLTITDDDPAPTVTLKLDRTAIREADDPATTGVTENVTTVTASLNYMTSAATTVTLSSLPGAYTVSTNAALTIAAGATASTGTVTLTAVNNSRDELLRTVEVTATTTSTRGIANPAPVTITIEDDDPSPRVHLTARRPWTIAEGTVLRSDGVTPHPQTVVVVARLDRPAESDVTVTLMPALAYGSPMLTSGTEITIPAGSLEGTATLTTVNDNIHMPARNVRINGAANNPLDDTPLVVTSSAVVQILEDDDNPTLTLSLDPTSISEDGGTTTVTAELDHPSAFSTTVRVLPATGYTVSTNAVLSIAALATESTGVVTLTAVDNDLDEADAAVAVKSGSPTNSGTVLKGTAPTLTIVDDEGAPTALRLTVDADVVQTGDQTSLGEGDGSTARVTAAVIGTARFGSDVTVTVEVGKSGDSAVEGTDYATVGRLTITIPAAQPSGSVTFALNPVDDELDEANETISVEGTASGLTVTSATITIIDNDAAPTVTLSLDPASISENGGTTTLKAELDHASSEATTVTVSANAAYTVAPVSRIITIAAGATEGTLTLTAVDNDVDARDNAVTVSATASNTLGVTNPAAVTLTITDDDTVPDAPTAVGATAGDARVEVSWTAPTNAGTSTITRYDVRHIAGDASDKSDANWTVVDGGSASPHTVTGLTNGQEYDFQVRAVSAAGSGAWTATVTATPAPPPVALPAVSVTGPSASVAEDGTMVFTLTRTEDTTDALTVTVAVTESGAMLPSSLPTTVTFAANSATASVSLNLPGDVVDEPDSVVTVTVQAGSDYNVGTPAAATGTATDDDTVPGVPTGVAATAGDTQVEVSWTAPTNAGTSAITRYDVRHIESDASDKSDGNWTVVNGGSASPHTVTGLTNSTVYDFQVRAVSAAGPGAWTATVTAVPADPTLPAVSVTGPSAGVAEDGTMVFTLTRTEATTDALTVNVRVTETGDMLPSRPPITMTATFSAGSATATVSLNLPGDVVDEPDSVVTVAVRAGDGYSVGTPASATGTATDNDEVPGVPTGVGATEGHEEIAVSWTAPTNAGTSPITGYEVRHIESAASDKSDARWTVVDAGNVTRHTVTGLTNDTDYDFQVRAVSAAGSSGWTATVRATPDASAVPTVTITGPSSSVAEGATMVFTLTRTAPTTDTLTVPVSVTETGDILITSKQWRYPCWWSSPAACDLPTTATFAAGSATATLSIDLAGDVEVEDDSVITVGVLGTGTGYILGSPSSATGTATDDDFGPGAPTVRISHSVRQGLEEGETLSFYLERSPAPAALTVNVRVTETGDMLYPGLPTTVTIGAGRTFGWLHLHLRDDNLAEPDSIVTLDLLKGNGYNVGNISSQTKTGIDHDPGVPTGVMTEAGDGQVEVSWTAPADDGATPAVTSYEVRHRESAAGNWTVAKRLAASPHRVTGLTDGQAYDFQVRAVNAKGISAWTATSRATTYASTVTIAGPGASVPEAGTMVFTLTHTGETSAELTVTVAVTETGDMLPANLPTTVTFAAGQSTATVSLDLPGDVVDEPNSVVTVAVQAGDGYNLGSPSSATGTATDDDTAPGVPRDVAATAGVARVEVSWKAPDRGGTRRITSYDVRYIASDAPDKSDGNWTPVNGGSASSRTVTVTGLTNGQEYDFQVRTVSAAGPSGWTETVTATPEDTALPAVTIAEPGASVAENGTMAFTLTRTGATTDELTVNVSVTETGAMLPSDLPTMATFAAGSATATVSLNLPGDEVDEPDSVVTVAVQGGDGYNLGTSASATGTATDDDEVPGTPTSPRATARDRQVEVSWTAPNAGTSAITRYDVRHIASDASDKSDGNWTVVDGGSASPHTVTGLTNGQEYDFQVRAVSAAGPSEWTDTVTATPPLPPVTIRPPASAGSLVEFGRISFVLERTGATTDALTVTVAVTETGAMLPSSLPTTATFGPGWSSATLWLDLPGDEVDEPDSDITAELVAGTGYVLGSPSSATRTATDDDEVPGVPTGAGATAGDGQVVVTWTAPTDGGTSTVTGYEVRHIASGASDKSDANWTVVDGGSASPHTVTGLTNGTSYDFQVRAVSAAGPSEWTATVTATPAAPALPTVSITGPSANVAEDGTMTFTLTRTEDTTDALPVTVAVTETGAMLPDTLPTTVTFAAGSATATVSLNLPGDVVDEDDSVVTVAVQAGSGYNLGSPSSATRTATDDDTVPGIPMGVGATAGHEQVAVSWTAPSDGGTSSITGYDVRYILTSALDKSNGNWTVVDGGAASPHTVTGLTNGTSYDFQVRAVSAAGPGGWTATVTATPAAPTVTITGPSANVAEDGTMVFTLTRTAPTTDALTVNVRVTETRTMLPSSLPTTATFAAGSATATVSLNLPGDVVDEPDSVVTVAVRAGDGYSVGTPASATGTATDDDTVPGVPTGVGATAGHEQVAVSWTAPTNAGTSAITRYDVRYKRSAAPDNNWRVVDGGAASPHTVTGLTNGTGYDFRVRAVSAAGSSGWTATVTATPDASALSTVTIEGPSDSVAEGATMVFTLTRTAPTTDALTVAVSVTETEDMLIKSQQWRYPCWLISPRACDLPTTATFAAGSATATLSLDLAGDVVDEADSVVTVTVEAGNGYNVGSPSTAMGTATDDDSGPGAPTVRISPGGPNEEEGETLILFLERSPVTRAALTVNVRVTETGDMLYPGLPTTVTIGAGRTFGWLHLHLRDDNLAEPDSIVTLDLLPGKGYNVGNISTQTRTGIDHDPGVPTGVTTRPGDAQVVVSWTAPADDAATPAVTSYEVRHRESAAGNWTVVKGLAASAREVTVTGLTDGQAYDFQVRAVNAKGISAWTRASRATTYASTVTIAGPGASVPEAGTMVFTLTRTAPTTRALTVTVAVTETGDMLPANLPTTVTFAAGQSTATVSLDLPGDLVDEPDSVVTVTLIDGATYHRGSPSSATGTATDDDTVPDPPTEVMTTPGDGRVEVTWTAPADRGTQRITRYDVRYIETDTAEDKSDDGDWTVVDGGASSPHTVTGLSNGQRYDFQVRAVSAAGAGDWTTTVAATPDTSLTTAPPIVVTPEPIEYVITYDLPRVYNDDAGVSALVSPSLPGGASWQWQWVPTGGEDWRDEQNRAGRHSPTFADLGNLYGAADIRATVTVGDERYYGPRIVVAGSTRPVEPGQ